MNEITQNAKQSLTAYTVFGYLLPGFFLVALTIFDFDVAKLITYYIRDGCLTVELFKDNDYLTAYLLNFFSTGSFTDFKIIPFLVFLFFCYLLGHIISSFSSLLIERKILKYLLKYPSEILFSEPNNETKTYLWKWWGKKGFRIFAGYHEPYSIEVQRKLAKAVKQILDIDDVKNRDLYWLCYSYIITSRPYLAGRVHHFVNLFGFSRNITAVFILYIFFRFVLFAVGANYTIVSLFMQVLYLLISFMMFINYTKLFKRQAKDIFNIFISIHCDTNMERKRFVANDGI
jgi:hypothetical protein